VIIELDSALADLAGGSTFEYRPAAGATAADAVQYLADAVGGRFAERVYTPDGWLAIIVAVQGEVSGSPATRDLEGVERILLFSPLAGG